MQKIIRVFPTKTSFSPTDKYCYFGEPDLFVPDFEEIHVSCTFSWDITRAKRLAFAWSRFCKTPVKISGPALDDPGNGFTPGMYLKNGITITSRGCPNKCWFCFVPKREGNIRELKIHDGNILLDNNLLACSELHIQEVFKMLSDKKGVVFSQGLEAARITTDIAGELSKLKIKSLWLAYDEEADLEPFLRAVSFLKKYFTQNKLRTYVLIGYSKDTIENAELRLKTAYRAGTLPFAMPYRDDKNNIPQEWKRLARKWSRPAIYKNLMEV